jgi:23S rRNA (adenine2503-C2)-methyltransferase
MGMGEPLLNVPEVSRTIGILLSQFGFGISGKRVTVSTAGIFPEMLPLARMHPVSFAVSINAARDDLRSLLMPANRKYPLKEVVAEMRRIPLQSGRKVTAEYVLLAGVNDSAEDALALSRLFRGARIKVNLIPYNPHAASPYQAPAADAVDRFRNVLVAGGVQTIRRERRGADIRAACGQLRTAERGKMG